MALVGLSTERRALRQSLPFTGRPEVRLGSCAGRTLVAATECARRVRGFGVSADSHRLTRVTHVEEQGPAPRTHCLLHPKRVVLGHPRVARQLHGRVANTLVDDHLAVSTFVGKLERFT